MPEEEISLINGFERKFSSVRPVNKRVLDLDYNSYYLAGTSEDRIYLGNFKVPHFLLETDYFLTDSQYVQLAIPTDKKLAWKLLKMEIDSPHVYIYERLTPTVFHGMLPELDYKRSHLNGLSFSKMVPITPKKVVIRKYDPNERQTELKLTSMNPSTQKPLSHTLQKQIDGIFCVDGLLTFNKELNQVIYVYFYRNQFLGLDTLMNVLYHGNTIDTVTQADIQYETIASENKHSLKKRKTVNKMVSTFGDKLYIRSGLKADNESLESYKANAVIDVYSLRNQEYLYSFYIPGFKNEKLYEFVVHDNKLVAIYTQYLVVYDLQAFVTYSELPKTLPKN